MLVGCGYKDKLQVQIAQMCQQLTWSHDIGHVCQLAMLMRPKQAETAVHGCQQSGSLFFMVDLGIKPTTNVAIVPYIMASSQLLAHLCYLHLTFIFIATFHKHYAFTTSYVLFGNLSLFANHTMLMRPKKAEIGVHGCQQSGSLFFMVDFGVKLATM